MTERANVISWSLYPRYVTLGRHLTPIVAEACKRVLWSDATVTLETISADAYRAATGEGRCEQPSTPRCCSGLPTRSSKEE